MRVEDVQQRLGDQRKVIVNAQMNTRGKQREGFQHALDVGIFAAIGFEQQTRRDLRVLVGELSSNLAQESEFALVIISQLITQGRLP